MGEFASNAKANTGVALGATGLGIAIANGLGAGLLGGLFRGPNQFGPNPETLNLLAQKDAEISLLKSENYSDKVGKEVYSQSSHDNNALRDEMYAYIKPLADEAANNRVNIARLEEQTKSLAEKQALREEVLTGKINEVALASNGRFNTLEAQTNGRFNTMEAQTTGKFNALEAQTTGRFNTLTAEVNGRMNDLNSSIACLAGTLHNITQTYVPACKVTPIPMPLANSYSLPADGTTFYPGCVSVGTGSSSSTSSTTTTTTTSD